jgi:hypothetical protein
MTANVSITLTNSKVLADTPIWAGVLDESNTDWLQSPIGSNSAIGAARMMIVDLQVAAASTQTTFSLDDTAALTAIPGVSGTEVLAVLSLVNNSGGFEPATAVHHTGATVVFTTASGTANDLHRLTILYR